MAALTPATPGRGTGVDMRSSAFAAAAPAGDTFPPGSDTYVHVRSTNSATVTLTVTPSSGGGPAGTTVSALALAPVVEANPGERIYGPFPANPFADVSDGQVHLTYSSTTYVNVRVLKISGS